MDENCKMTEAELQALEQDAKEIEWLEYVEIYGPRAFAPDDDGPWQWEK